MAISFKKPTWHNDVVVWNWDADTSTWVEGATITGQIYTPLRNSDDEEGGLIYFEYPKEDDELRDRWDYGNTGDRDFILFSFPTGGAREVGYWVEDVLPRWLGFSNEHLIAVLIKMTPAEITQATSGNEQPTAPSLLSQLTANTNTRPADGVSAIQFTLTLIDSFGNPVANPGPLTLVPSGNGIVISPNPDDTTDGWYAWVVVNNTVETETYSVAVGGVTVTSTLITWTSPSPPPAAGTLDIAGVANDSCTDCAMFNDSFAMNEVASGTIWYSDEFDWPCVGMDVVIKVQYHPGTDTIDCVIIPAAGGAYFVGWYADASSWDHASTISIDTYAGASGNECTWPTSVDFTP